MNYPDWFEELWVEFKSSYRNYTEQELADKKYICYQDMISKFIIN